MRKYIFKFEHWADKIDKWMLQQCVINDARDKKEALEIAKQHISEFTDGKLVSFEEVAGWYADSCVKRKQYPKDQPQ